ncbi:MAG: cation diffusion facilitator family transporter [Clostridiales bacterium]|nr:cation diffusion facilitator family transporter [Clostridiales bacterium]
MFIEFITKKFIKNYKDIENRSVRQSYGTLVSIIGLIINSMLFLIEFIIGILVNSIAVTADSFDKLSDASSSVITLAGFKLSNKPADKEHPFGHGRIEYLSAMLVASLILLVGVRFISSSFSRILKPQDVKFNIIFFLIILLAIPLKLYLSHLNKYIGKKINSSALKAAGADSLNDVFTLSGVVLSMIISGFLHIHIDGYVGVLIAFAIIMSGISIMKDTIDPLLGEAPDPTLVKEIKRLALSHKLIIGIHDLVIHNYGPGRCMASFHAEVPYNVDIMTLHSEIDKTEKEITNKLNIFTVIHMDPVCNDSKEISDAKEEVLAILKKFPEIGSMHDFRVVGKGKDKNLIFDIVIPFGIKVSPAKKELLKQELTKEIKKKHPAYDAVITVDRDYTT